MRDADLVVALDGGVVAERGTRAELLAADGLYARLFRTQAAGYRDEPGSPAQPLVKPSARADEQVRCGCRASVIRSRPGFPRATIGRDV